MLLRQESNSEGDFSYPLLNTYYYPQSLSRASHWRFWMWGWWMDTGHED